MDPEYSDLKLSQLSDNTKQYAANSTIFARQKAKKSILSIGHVKKLAKIVGSWGLFM